MHNLWIDGRCLKEFGIYVSGEKTFNAPEKDYESISIPGRNGDLLISKNRFKNINVLYPAFILKDFKQNAAMARGFMLSKFLYRRIEDDYHPDTYRMGIFTGPMDFDTKFLNLSAEVQLQFSCKPQRFLKSGDLPRQILTPQTLYNSYMPSLPLIKVVGSGAGTVTVGDVTVTIENISEFIVLDSDTQNAYKGNQNQNGNIRLSNYQFPALQSGENRISFSGGVQSLEIIPRWWTV